MRAGGGRPKSDQIRPRGGATSPETLPPRPPYYPSSYEFAEERPHEHPIENRHHPAAHLRLHTPPRPRGSARRDRIAALSPSGPSRRTGRFGDRRRWRARRGGVAEGSEDRAQVRDAAGGEHSSYRGHGGVRHLRRPFSLRGLPRARSPSVGHPRPRLGPRQRLQRRFRGDRRRHLQRRAARLRILRQSARRPDGPVHGRRERQRGLLLGRHLERGRQNQRGWIHRRDRRPLQLPALPSDRGRADLGDRRPAFLSAQPARPDLRPSYGSQHQLLSLSKLEDDRLLGDHARTQPRARAHGHRHPHGSAGGFSFRIFPRGRSQIRAGSHGEMGSHSEPHLERRLEPRLLPGRGRHRPARRQHPVRPLLSGEAPLLPRGRRLLRHAVQHCLHPQRGRSLLGRQADRQRGEERDRRLRRPGRADQPPLPRQHRLLGGLLRAPDHRRRASLPAGFRQLLSRGRPVHGSRGKWIPEPLWRGSTASIG